MVKEQARLIVDVSVCFFLASTKQATVRTHLFKARHVLPARSLALLASAVTQNQRLVHGRLDVPSYSAKRACHNNF
jgi:hypothetical protein